MSGKGVRTIADLLARCWVDDDTGCWHWRLAKSGGLPSLWYPPLEKRTTLSTVICHLVTGDVPKKGRVWHINCTTRGCANPEHRKNGTRSSQMAVLGLKRSPLTLARMSAGRRAGSALTDESVAAIRAGIGLLRLDAERYGCSPGHVWAIRRGIVRKASGAPGSSVFNFAGAA